MRGKGREEEGRGEGRGGSNRGKPIELEMSKELNIYTGYWENLYKFRV